LVKKGIDLISSRPTGDFSVDDVARALDVSYRTLHYAFKDQLGTSPYQYLLTQRLHAVRRILKSSDLSVTEACVAYGFNTPSRFSRQYARLFGELPSETKYGNGRHLEASAAEQ
jgi:AraC family ethanolamine operon transcriptional activator